MSRSVRVCSIWRRFSTSAFLNTYARDDSPVTNSIENAAKRPHLHSIQTGRLPAQRPHQIYPPEGALSNRTDQIQRELYTAHRCPTCPNTFKIVKSWQEISSRIEPVEVILVRILTPAPPSLPLADPRLCLSLSRKRWAVSRSRDSRKASSSTGTGSHASSTTRKSCSLVLRSSRTDSDRLKSHFFLGKE